MRILILFLITFGILFAQQDLGMQEDIDTGYKRMAREKKKVIIPEIVGLKAEDQKKLFDRSSKTYVEFPILPENKPSIVIKTPANQMVQGEHWRMVFCSDLGEKFDLKYARIKKMKTIVRAIFKDGKNEITSEDDDEYDGDDANTISILVDNIDIHAGHSDHARSTVKHFLIEIYIEDAFRKETGKLCVSEILPFADR
ncbi:hypothetical protein LEP1GSC080_0306 [Leptospira interrogans str. FPW2026]|uniref:hypothetical protein n=1 Tax=Leptospira interrogans TaxID=173 RepID=UPI00027862AE|nr:hypothetical protein [Leptospira interrogans]EJP13211.1 hypothetical protein LEP1GSC080_0306 [Leptospira interrogans str. FPW2026]